MRTTINLDYKFILIAYEVYDKIPYWLLPAELST